jgi:hypothetical protein
MFPSAGATSDDDKGCRNATDNDRRPWSGHPGASGWPTVRRHSLTRFQVPTHLFEVPTVPSTDTSPRMVLSTDGSEHRLLPAKNRYWPVRQLVSQSDS